MAGESGQHQGENPHCYADLKQDWCVVGVDGAATEIADRALERETHIAPLARDDGAVWRIIKRGMMSRAMFLLLITLLLAIGKWHYRGLSLYNGPGGPGIARIAGARG